MNLTDAIARLEDTDLPLSFTDQTDVLAALVCAREKIEKAKLTLRDGWPTKALTILEQVK